MSKSLSDLLGTKNSPLGNLARHADRMEQLGSLMRENLPASLADGFVHCNVRDDGTLVVVASSSEWAARYRFETAEFTRVCSEQGLEITKVKVSVSASDL